MTNIKLRIKLTKNTGHIAHSILNNMIDKNINRLNKQKINSLSRTYHGLSKLLLEFNLDFDDFCKSLRKYYVLEAYKTSKTVTRTSLKVSIDRRIVSAILNNKKQYQRPSLIITILNRIETLASKNNMTVNKKGNNSVESIILDVAYGATTINSVINELVALGCIEDIGTEIKFVANKIVNTTDRYKLLLQVSNHLDRYINTFVKNLQCNHQDQKSHQFHIFSTKIPPEKSLDLYKTTHKILSATNEKLQNLYKKYEQPVAENTYKEIGVSINQFDLNPKNKDK